MPHKVRVDYGRVVVVVVDGNICAVLKLLNKGRHWVLVVRSQHFPCASFLLTERI
jgi:hypothetical protein